jgi:predicted transcriptional regulator
VAEKVAKGTRVSGTARDSLASELSTKYKNGASIRELAAETGRSYGFIHRLLVESGVTLRGRGGAPASRRKAT